MIEDIWMKFDDLRYKKLTYPPMLLTTTALITLANFSYWLSLRYFDEKFRLQEKTILICWNKRLLALLLVIFFVYVTIVRIIIYNINNLIKFSAAWCFNLWPIRFIALVIQQNLPLSYAILWIIFCPKKLKFRELIFIADLINSNLWLWRCSFLII